MSVSRLLRRTLLRAAALLLVLPSAAAAAPPFAPDSVFNLPLRADAPLHARSAAWVSWLRATVAANGTWINSTSCGMPIYTATAGTARVSVTLDHPSYMDPALIKAWSSVPIPAGAVPANCADKNFAVLQTQPDGRIAAWEFWAARKDAAGKWIANWGGATSDLAADRGTASSLTWTDPGSTLTSSFGWNVTGSSVSMLAGVITLEDLQRGSIDHAGAMATTDAAAGSFLWPAQRTDGGSTDADALPEGAHLRLDPSLDVDALAMTPLVRMIAKAAQRYGIVVRDRTYSANVFYVQQPPAGTTNPVPTLLDNQYPSTALQAFPWERLQVLDAPTCSGWAACKAPATVRISSDTAAPRQGSPVVLDTSNSLLDQPRADVRWDLDGDGTYERAAGRDVGLTFTPATSGTRKVGVRITLRGGTVATGSRDVAVAPSLSATPAEVTWRPTALTAKYFYSYSSAYTALAAVSATTAPPTVPSGSRKLYTSNTAGTTTVTLGTGAIRAGAKLLVWVECSAARCLRLKALDGAGATLATADPPFSAKGWVTLDVPVATTGLRLAATVRNAGSAAGQAAISAVQAVVVPA